MVVTFKQKAAMRYLLQSYRNPILLFYGISLSAFLLLSIITNVWVATVEPDMNINGLNVASMIFLFVCGLNAFKEDFNLFLQNGVSRKTQFTAQCLIHPVVAVAMAAVDVVVAELLAAFIPYDSLYGMIYGKALESGFSGFVLHLAWLFCLYLFVLFFGYLITVLYYRMGNKLKVLVSVGVPVFCVLVLPLLDTLLNHRISDLLLNLVKTVFGLQNEPNPLIGMLFLLACAAVCGLFTRLLQRCAMLK